MVRKSKKERQEEIQERGAAKDSFVEKKEQPKEEGTPALEKL